MGKNRSLKRRKRPSQDRSRATVEAIMAAAAQVFGQRGYAGTNTNRIATRAGVSIGSVYQYFPNKDSLLVALMERHQESSAAVLGQAAAQASARGSTLEQTVELLVTALLALHARDPELHHVIFHQAPRPAAMVRRLHQIEERAADRVRTLLAEGFDLERRHAGHVAYIVVHLLEALTHEYVLHPPPGMDERAFTAELSTLVLGYLRAPCPQ